jgi:hypothetical protein
MDDTKPETMRADHYDARLKRIKGRVKAAQDRRDRARRAVLEAVTACELASCEEMDAAAQLERFTGMYVREST